MENLKFGIFDFFGRVIPGAFLYFAIILPFNNQINNLNFLNSFLKDLSTASVIFHLVMSYVVSFVFHFLSEFVVKFDKKYAPEIFYNKARDVEALRDNLPLMLTAIRKYSLDNSIFIEEWAAKRTMAFNLSISFAFLCIAASIKIALTSVSDEKDWIILAILSFIAIFISFYRGLQFNKWYFDDVYWAVKLIEQKEKINILGIDPLTNL